MDIDWRQVGEYVMFGAALVTAFGVLYRQVVVPTLTRVVSGAVRTTVNGGLEQINRRMDRHDRRHVEERRQLVQALDRNGISPPDGWRDVPDE